MSSHSPAPTNPLPVSVDAPAATFLVDALTHRVALVAAPLVKCGVSKASARRSMRQRSLCFMAEFRFFP